MRIATSTFSRCHTRTGGPLPVVCRDNCLAVGTCSGRIYLCALRFPGSRMYCNFLGFLIPFCAGIASSRANFRVTGFVHRLGDKSIRTFVRHLGVFFSNVPCRLDSSARHRCRIVFRMIFALLKRFVQSRIHDDHNHTSTMIRALATVCIFRFGLSNATSTTLGRVSRGNCLVPCALSNEGLIGMNIGFDGRAQGVSRCVIIRR